jgi:phosphoribosyl 1,2-cyclic phosphodiesterase
MSRICPLSSSSKGNSTFLSGADTSLLIDAGISFRRIRNALESQGLDAAGLSAVLITHEHTDHVKGLYTLLKHLDIPLFGAPETLRELLWRRLVPPSARLIPIEGTFCVGDIEISPFDTPHDAVHSIGFRFRMPDGRQIGFATDLGHITDAVRENLTGCDLVVLESNYDPGMLSCSSYPYPLKVRIRGDYGHLSNEDCAGELVRLVQSGTTRIVLGHLSEQNNLPQIAMQTAQNILNKMQMRERSDYLLTVAPAQHPHEMVVF